MSAPTSNAWQSPEIRTLSLGELQAHWPRLLSVESSLYASGCHRGRHTLDIEDAPALSEEEEGSDDQAQ